MATALNNGLEELKGKTSGTIHLANNWGARTVVVCRGYLESSKELSKDLANVGLAKPVASRISESPRWTEGTHFYLVKNQKVLYFHCPRLHMENVNRDFLHATVDEKLYLDVTSTTDFHLAGIR
jgi:hypothetical protein